jgi:Asp-tRNA(Asn)/Glu-tRNA(Gln) amidotransferase A subunit family amidase
MTEPSPHPAGHWAYLSAGELAQCLQKNQISALELTDQFIARIEVLDGDLNAVPVRDFARAREAAKAADAALARGERRPLLGVPITIKESYNIAGLPTTWGIPAFKDFVAQEDALAVTRLKARRGAEPSRLAAGGFRATGPQAAMARPVSRLRRRHLSARRDAGLPHDHSPDQDSRKLAVDGKEFPYLFQLLWAELATTCGLPATVIPIAVADGLPIGVQIIGPEFEDRTPLAFARLIEREFGGFTPPPGYASAQ